MASDSNAIKVVDRADLEDDRLVKVESVEKGSLFSFLSGTKIDDDGGKTEHGSSSVKKEHESDSQHKKVHEGDEIRSTYDVEEDVPPSLLEQFKRKIHWNGR